MFNHQFKKIFEFGFSSRFLIVHMAQSSYKSVYILCMTVSGLNRFRARAYLDSVCIVDDMPHANLLAELRNLLHPAGAQK